MRTITLREQDSIQAVLDELASAGGGELVVPAGRWPVGEVSLRSGIRLRLAAGCTLEGVLLGTSVTNIAVMGEGADASVVTRGLVMDHADGIECHGWAGRQVVGKHVRHGRFSHLRLHQAPRRQAEGSVVWFFWAEDLHFSDCDLESNDDVFCLKRAAENVTLTRSRLCGRMGAPYKIGTETDGLFRNIVFTDSVIERSDRAAISLESVDGAVITDVRIERIRMEDVDAPLFIRLGARDRYAAGIGEIRNILISDIEGYGDTMDEGYGSCISGLPGHPVRDIVLRDIRFVARGGQSAALAAASVPERAELYPEFDMFGKLPAHGLYARHVEGLRLERVSLTTTASDGRPAIVLEDAPGVTVLGTDAPVVRPLDVAAETLLPAGDVDALLAAIHDAKAGDTIVVEPGDYAIPRDALPITLDRPGLTLTSREGAEHTRIRAVGARQCEGAQTDVLLSVSADRVSVTGLTLSAAVYNIQVTDAADCVIADNSLDFAKMHQIRAERARRLRITDNRSRATLNASMKLVDCHACVLRDNLFREDPAAIRLAGSTHCEIAANRFEEISWDGVLLDHASHDNAVTGNLLAGGRLTGIQVRASDRAEITGNTFTGHKRESVLVDRGSRDVRLRGNRFHDNRGMAVSNETPHTVDAAGNWWGSPAGPVVGVEVDANVCVEPWLTEAPEAPEA